MKSKVKNYLQLFLCFFIYSIVSVFAKMASQQENLLGTIIFMGVEFCILVWYAFFWQQIIKKFPLTIAMACKGVSVIYAILWSVILFKERITVWNIVGAALVTVGIGVVSSDD